MIEFFNSIKDRIGMDANNFYPALITLFSLIFPALLKIYSSFSNNIKNKIWDLRYKEESDFFYIVVLVKELLFTFVQAFLLVYLISGFNWLLTYLGLPISKKETKVFIVLFVWVAFCLGVGFFILKSKKVRERCLDLGDKQLVLLLPYWIYNIIMVLILYQIRVDVLDYILTAIMIVGEIYGLYIFRGRYIKYDYSSAKIFTENGHEIECKDVSKMKRKGSALIISDINRQVRIKYGSINKVEYYGTERVILKDTWNVRIKYPKFKVLDTIQEKCVAKIMKHLCKDTQDAERWEVLVYGLKCFVGEGIKIAFLLLIFGLAGVFWEFIFAFISLLAVRRFIGGSHRETATGCFIQSLLVFTLIVVLGKWLIIPMIGVCVLFAVTLLWVWLKGPVVSKKRGGYTRKHFLQFKIKATVTLTVIFAIGIFVHNPLVNYMIWAVVIQLLDAMMAAMVV